MIKTYHLSYLEVFIIIYQFLSTVLVFTVGTANISQLVQVRTPQTDRAFVSFASALRQGHVRTSVYPLVI